MITNNQLKIYKNLSQKKYRKIYQLFIAEGTKTIIELLNSGHHCEMIVINKKKPELLSAFTAYPDIVEDILPETFQKLSQLQNPQGVMGIFKIPELKTEPGQFDKKLTFVLDDIQDPGNLGSIIRIADWYGIENIICSTNSVDVYNPKVIQATMGAIARVNVFYRDLEGFLNENKKTIYGTFLEGENIYETSLNEDCFVLFGNEGNGISKILEKYVTKKLFIPSFPPERQSVESLNISIAAGIMGSEFRRMNYSK